MKRKWNANNRDYNNKVITALRTIICIIIRQRGSRICKVSTVVTILIVIALTILLSGGILESDKLVHNHDKGWRKETPPKYTPKKY